MIYGHKKIHVRNTSLPDVPCPFCTALDTLHVSLFGQYAHIYYIPVFPLGKPAVVACSNCHLSWEDNAMPPALSRPLRAVKKKTRLPLWTWSGLAILALAMGWAAVADARDDRENKAFLEAPRVGDIYTVRAKADDKTYSLLKVVSVKGPTVDVVPNEYTIDNNQPIGSTTPPNTAKNPSR